MFFFSNILLLFNIHANGIKNMPEDLNMFEVFRAMSAT